MTAVNNYHTLWRKQLCEASVYVQTPENAYYKGNSEGYQQRKRIKDFSPYKTYLQIGNYIREKQRQGLGRYRVGYALTAYTEAAVYFHKHKQNCRIYEVQNNISVYIEEIVVVNAFPYKAENRGI